MVGLYIQGKEELRSGLAGTARENVRLLMERGYEGPLGLGVREDYGFLLYKGKLYTHPVEKLEEMVEINPGDVPVERYSEAALLLVAKWIEEALNQPALR